ncbi:MAG: AI-2E family transporter [Aestuariivirga sp.]
MSATETAYVLRRFVDTVHATVFGKLVVAAVQGTLGGLMFWWLGLPLPILWGAVMGMLAIVPVLGAFVIWVPAAVYLALEGEWGKALILAAWGGGVVASIDNILYPMLVGNRLKLHTVPAFIGAIGGIVIFGASGLILGPAIISVTLALIKILKKRFNKTTSP